MYPTTTECVGIISKKRLNSAGKTAYLIFIPLQNANRYRSISLTLAIVQGIVMLDPANVKLDRIFQQGLIYSFDAGDSYDFSGYIVDCSLNLSV